MSEHDITRQFNCEVCGSHVMCFGFMLPDEGRLCGTCSWIYAQANKIADPDERGRFIDTMQSLIRGLRGATER